MLLTKRISGEIPLANVSPIRDEFIRTLNFRSITFVLHWAFMFSLILFWSCGDSSSVKSRDSISSLSQIESISSITKITSRMVSYQNFAPQWSWFITYLFSLILIIATLSGLAQAKISCTLSFSKTGRQYMHFVTFSCAHCTTFCTNQPVIHPSIQPTIHPANQPAEPASQPVIPSQSFSHNSVQQASQPANQ